MLVYSCISSVDITRYNSDKLDICIFAIRHMSRPNPIAISRLSVQDSKETEGTKVTGRGRGKETTTVMARKPQSSDAGAQQRGAAGGVEPMFKDAPAMAAQENLKIDRTSTSVNRGVLNLSKVLLNLSEF